MLPFTEKMLPFRNLSFCLGQPEAEAEFTGKNGFLLRDLFVDELNVLEAIKNGKFIIVGRKGTGKSAVAIYYLSKSKEEGSDSYVEIVKPDFGRSSWLKNFELSEEEEYRYYFQWLIVGKLIKLIIDSDIAPYSPEIISLRRFYQKNFDLFQINESSGRLKPESLNISVNLLMTSFGAGFARENKRDDRTPQPFYVFLPGLMYVVGKVLKMPLFKDTTFKVMFDDLDVNLDLNDPSHCMKLLSLLRVAKEFNNNVTLSERTSVIVFLREDVEHKLENIATDAPKIFGSYSFTLNWFEDAKLREVDMKLRRFLNKRISSKFEQAGVDYNTSDPWKSYVEERKSWADSTVFKDLMDWTFFRPRDFLNLFLPLAERNYSLPLDSDSLKKLLKLYSERAFAEITAEMCAKYSPHEINRIKRLLYMMAQRFNNTGVKSLTYKALVDLDPDFINDALIEDMYNYDLIGLVDYNGDLHFHSREPLIASFFDMFSFCLPNIIRLYLDKSFSIRL